MGTNRHLDVLMVVNEIARADEKPADVRHVCLACRIGLDAAGVGICLAGTAQPVEVVGTTGDEMAELQVTLGEGPVPEALRQNRPVFVSDLTGGSSARRWPVFAPAAVAAGVAAVFVIPLTLGAIALGASEICRDVDGPLSADALLFADAATMLLLGRSPMPAALGVADLPHSEPDGRWAVVHQATGMVSVQLGTDLGEALLRLRAHAYLTGLRLSEVAADVVALRLRFSPDTNHEKQR